MTGVGRSSWEQYSGPDPCCRSCRRSIDPTFSKTEEELQRKLAEDIEQILDNQEFGPLLKRLIAALVDLGMKREEHSLGKVNGNLDSRKRRLLALFLPQMVRGDVMDALGPQLGDMIEAGVLQKLRGVPGKTEIDHQLEVLRRRNAEGWKEFDRKIEEAKDRSMREEEEEEEEEEEFQAGHLVK